MIYFTVRNELKLMNVLLNNFEKIISIEKDVRDQIERRGTKFIGPYNMFKTIREEASKTVPDYQELRVIFAKMIPKANEICDREKISWYRKGYSAQIEGSMPFQGSIFEFVLNRPSDIMDLDTLVRDTVNQTIGVLETKEKKEFINLIDPFYWLVQIIIFIVRLPYSILKLSGFNVEKIQEHLFARLFQLIYVIFLILILVWLGLEPFIDLKSLFSP